MGSKRGMLRYACKSIFTPMTYKKCCGPEKGQFIGFWWK